MEVEDLEELRDRLKYSDEPKVDILVDAMLVLLDAIIADLEDV